MAGVVDLSMVRNWIIVGGTSFLVIGAGLIAAKWVAAKGVPVLSSIATGILSFWKLTQ